MLGRLRCWKSCTLAFGRAEFFLSRESSVRGIGEPAIRGFRHMELLSRALGGLLISFVVTSANAVIMLDPTPSWTGDMVGFNLHPPTQSSTGDTTRPLSARSVVFLASLNPARAAVSKARLKWLV